MDDKEREIADLKARLADLEEEKVTVGTPPAPKKGKALGVGCGAVIVIFLFLALVGAMVGGGQHNDSGNTTTSTGDNTMTTADSTPAKAPAPLSRWLYNDEGRDEMHGTVEKSACISSTSAVRLTFPYHSQDLTLCFRHSHLSGNTYIKLPEGGQFYCVGIDGCSIEIRIDHGKVQHFGAQSASGGQNDTLFLSGGPRLAQALKRAKSMTMEIEFYGAGSQQISFDDVGGLVWK